MMSDQIAFQVETSRVLEILSREIYDSPLALLRENLQNAYDAVLMRSALEGIPLTDGLIEIEVAAKRLVVADNGIGMAEDVLRNNFWRAGSSGKNSELAKQSGVIGTFGIGAMANFGVARSLRVETRACEADVTLVSVAHRDTLSIAKECIGLERLTGIRSPGTTITVDLDDASTLDLADAKEYLHPYVRFLPVAVRLNGELISQQSLEGRFAQKTQAMARLPVLAATLGAYQASVDTLVDFNGSVCASVSQIKCDGEPIAGEMTLVQNGGQLMGLRNYFGLAPIPVSGFYQFGGMVNLSILQPTAGREALSRESIEQVSRLVTIAEWAVSQRLAETDYADKNTCFMQHVVSLGQVQLAKNVTIEVLPQAEAVPLGHVTLRANGRTLHYYTGRDQAIMQTFASDQSWLLNISQANPRRQLQTKYVTDVLRVPGVPDRATILRKFDGTELTLEEAALVVRVAATLSEDYFLSDAEVRFAQISHGVTFLVEKPGNTLEIYLARDSATIRPVLACYGTAYEVFGGIVKDFVRNHLYKRVSQYVPSTTKEGADALCRILQRNRELYRYEESDLGELEPLLSDYLAGDATLGEILRRAKSVARPQTVRVQSNQVGQVEQALPDVVESVSAATEPVTEGAEYEAAPSIMRPEVTCDMKILLTGQQYPQLNGFKLFLGLSDRLFKREGDFFRAPHTTKVIWGGHRVIYIFGHASGRLTLYYDIELKEQLTERQASGVMVPTTTLFTKDRIFVPVPPPLVPEFRITEGVKEFFVRFDTVVN